MRETRADTSRAIGLALLLHALVFLAMFAGLWWTKTQRPASAAGSPVSAELVDAGGCYVMPGGIDPHTHLEMPFMGTYSSDDFESGTRAAMSGGTTMVVDFVLPGQGQGLMDAAQMWHNKSGRANCDYSYHMAVTWWGEQVFDEMKSVIEKEGITTFKPGIWLNHAAKSWLCCAPTRAARGCGWC